MPIDAAQWKTYLEDKRAFFDNVVNGMVGWLDPFAALRTIDLLEYQQANQIGGSLLEIGLYHGKYFATLARSAAMADERVVGLDTFDYVSLDAFHTYFNEHFSPGALASVAKLDLRIVRGASGDFTERKLMGSLGSEARFISVDGSHEYDDVMWDLKLAERVLSAGGIIAADDYLNPICLGVTAAVDHFLYTTPTIKPFAYIANKLFLCRPAWADRYRAAAEAAVLADTTSPKALQYRKHHEAGAYARRNIEATYSGCRILTIAM